MQNRCILLINITLVFTCLICYDISIVHILCQGIGEFPYIASTFSEEGGSEED